MKRQLILAFMAILVAMPAMATQSRLGGFVGLGGYIPDDTEVSIFPQVLNQWRNRVIVELGGFGNSPGQLTSRYAGVHVRMERLGVDTGVYVNQPMPSPRLDFSDVDSPKMATLIVNRDKWGVQASLGGDSYKNDNLPDTPVGDLEKESASFIGFGAGITLQLGSATSDIGAKVGILSAKAEFDDPAARGGVPFDDESGFLFDFAIRNQYDQGRNGKLIAIGRLAMMNDKITIERVDDDARESKETNLAAGVGLGWMYPATNSVTVVLVCEPFRIANGKEEGVTDADGDSNFEDKFSTLFLPSFFAGVEARANKYVTARAGVVQSYLRESEEGTEVIDGGASTTVFKDSWTESIFNFTAGLSVHLGDTFWLDGVFNDQWFYTGPQFIGGNDFGQFPTGTPLTQVSFGAHWN